MQREIQAENERMEEELEMHREDTKILVYHKARCDVCLNFYKQSSQTQQTQLNVIQIYCTKITSQLYTFAEMFFNPWKFLATHNTHE